MSKDSTMEEDVCTPHSFANYRGAVPVYPYRSSGTSTPELQWKQVYVGDLRLCNSIPRSYTLRSIDTEHIAEEFIKVLSRVGVPKEILTD